MLLAAAGETSVVFNVFLYLFITLFIIVSILLILIVLIQKGRGGGLASAFGGAGGNTAFGSKTGDVLTWATSIIFGVFLILAIILNLMSRDTSTTQASRSPQQQQQPAGGNAPGANTPLENAPTTRPLTPVVTPATLPTTRAQNTGTATPAVTPATRPATSPAK